MSRSSVTDQNETVTVADFRTILRYAQQNGDCTRVFTQYTG
ncbi:hypothetical protein [Streptomyces sp. NPDC046985]